MEVTKIRSVIERHLVGIDEDTLDYFQGIVADQEGLVDELSIKESLGPLIEAYGFASSLEHAETICKDICSSLQDLGMKVTSGNAPESVLLTKCIQLSHVTKLQISETDQASIDTLWGFDKIRDKKNDIIETTEAGSAKYERTAEKEQKKWLAELEAKFVGDDSNNEISTMTLPDYSGKNREKDIQVQNFNITFGNVNFSCRF